MIKLIMGRKKNTTPAVCPVCKYDFGDVCKNRYSNLKRHMETVHPGVTYNHYDHCTTNNNMIVLTNLGESQILKLLDETILNEINKRLLEGEDMALFLFDRIHCDSKHPENHNVVIPNLGKNELLVFKDGRPTKYKKKEGGKVVLETFFDKEIPVVSDRVDDPCFDTAMSLEVREMEEMSSKLIEHLELQDPYERAKDTKRILCDQGPIKEASG